MVDIKDTICSLSTAPGRAGIAVVRLSGPESFRIISALFVPARKDKAIAPRQTVLGSIMDAAAGKELDEVLVTQYPAPHSYTGENVVEISLHGSPVLVATLLDRLCSAGSRLAEPGEFTMRAFLSGRMDLVQAEAVRDVIEATTLFQAQVAGRQRSGALSRQLQPLKQALIDVIVVLESAVEFVEDDLALESREAIALKLVGVRTGLKKWIDTFRRGRIVRDGFSMAIVGRPNVGKSSLFNALLSQERSIVTDIPGTTRDLVSEFTNLEGIPVRLVDTAGVRVSKDIVERIGVDRSYQAMADSDTILLVVDLSQRPAPEDEYLRERLPGLSCIVVFNKRDLAPNWSSGEMVEYVGGWPSLQVSARTGSGIDELKRTILRRLFGDESGQQDGIMITNLRQCRSLEAAEASLAGAEKALHSGLSEEFVLVDLHAALKQLGAVTGETSVEDLLGEIFSRFCIGK
jgi:tRNA modification GTPase